MYVRAVEYNYMMAAKKATERLRHKVDYEAAVAKAALEAVADDYIEKHQLPSPPFRPPGTALYISQNAMESLTVALKQPPPPEYAIEIRHDDRHEYKAGWQWWRTQPMPPTAPPRKSWQRVTMDYTLSFDGVKTAVEAANESFKAFGDGVERLKEEASKLGVELDD